MRRIALPVAVAALLALGALVVLELMRPSAAPTRAEQARLIAAELRCPDCQALSVAESQTAGAAAIRRQIVEQLAAGRTPEQVRAYFVARYGEWILLAPRREGFNLLVWVVPFAGLAVGLILVALLVVRWTRRSAPAAPTPPVDATVRERIAKELAELEKRR